MISSFYGTVTDLETGKPIGNATVTCPWHEAIFSTKTFPDGTYLLDVLADSNYTLYFYTQGYFRTIVPNLDAPNHSFKHVCAALQPSKTNQEIPAPLKSLIDFRKKQYELEKKVCPGMYPQTFFKSEKKISDININVNIDSDTNEDSDEQAE